MGDLPKLCCVCDGPGGKHCTSCKTRHYCGKKCQLVDWHERGHKEACKQLAADFQDRLLDSLFPEKLKVKEEPGVVEDVAPVFKAPCGPVFRTTATAESKAAAVSKAPPRGPVVRTAATAESKAGAVNDKPDWRGICAICLDLLPVEGDRHIFYACCCKRICTECSAKCLQYDVRCPLCRATCIKSHAEWLLRVQKHVAKGNAEAQSQLGDAYHHGHMGLKRSFKRASKLFELAASQGHAKAQAALAKSYEHGHGVKMDAKAAVRWNRRAADQGFPPAQNNLGVMFYDGLGVAQSFDEAVKWYRLAAQQGQPDALYNLGACHANGQGVPEDDREALRFYKRAVAQGNVGAAAAVEEVQARLAADSGL
jgi:TPR repeat protein